MKKILCLVLFMGICFTLSGCAEKEEKYEGKDYIASDDSVLYLGHKQDNETSSCTIVYKNIRYNNQMSSIIPGDANSGKYYYCNYKVTDDGIIITLYKSDHYLNPPTSSDEVDKLYGKFSYDFEKLDFEEADLSFEMKN